MGMWFKSDAWADGIATFNAWYAEACNFVNREGDYDVDKSFGANAYLLIDFVKDVMHMDPEPIWETFLAIDNWMDHRRCWRPGGMPTRMPISEIEALRSKCQMLWERAHRVGKTNVRPDKGDQETQPTYGVSLFDIALVHESGDDLAARELVRDLSKKRLGTKPIGKDPTDKRAQLYELTAILSELENCGWLGKGEKRRYSKALSQKVRSPSPQS